MPVAEAALLLSTVALASVIEPVPVVLSIAIADVPLEFWLLIVTAPNWTVPLAATTWIAALPRRSALTAPKVEVARTRVDCECWIVPPSDCRSTWCPATVNDPPT